MVRVQVGDQNAGDRCTIEVVFENVFPYLAGRVGENSGIGNGPAVAILQQPDIDVAQQERQRQACISQCSFKLVKWQGQIYRLTPTRINKA